MQAFSNLHVDNTPYPGCMLTSIYCVTINYILTTYYDLRRFLCCKVHYQAIPYMCSNFSLNSANYSTYEVCIHRRNSTSSTSFIEILY